jgi:polyhydroxybutyrate depolymerase
MPAIRSRRAAVALMILALGGCGGGGGGGDPGPTATPTASSTPGPTASPTPTPTANPTAAPTATPPPGADLNVVRSVTVGELEHNYRLYVPGRLTGAANVPLVVSLHGGGTDAANHDIFTRLRITAAIEGFALMTPNGYGQTWNAGSCCRPSSFFNVDHVGAIDAMLDDVATVINVDTNRVFATGHSNGGMLAYRLACELSDRIAAIASNAAVMMDTNLDTQPPTEVYACQPTRPVPVLHIHGLADRCAPFEGGVSAGVAGGTRESAAETIDFWVANNRCTLAPLLPSYSNGAARCEQHSLCQQGANVELCTIDGAGHVWPGNGFAPAEGDVCGGTGSDDLDANTYIWDFFRTHPRR